MEKIKKYLAVWLVICIFGVLFAPAEIFAEEIGAETMESVSASSIKYKSSEEDIDTVVSDNQPAVSENTELNMENRSISENDTVSDTVRILFVGNSFTRYHKMDVRYSVPKQLQELASLTGKKVMADCVTNGAAKLSYYAGMSAKYKTYYQQLVTKLMEKEWDYVVLQEQSVVPAFSADAEMGPAVASLQKLIGKLRPQAKLLLYMTHAYEFAGDKNQTAIHTGELQKRVGAAYLHIGSEYGIDVVPVGMQFQRASVFYSDQQFFEQGRKTSVKAWIFCGSMLLLSEDIWKSAGSGRIKADSQDFAECAKRNCSAGQGSGSDNKLQTTGISACRRKRKYAGAGQHGFREIQFNG